ncbi:MAG: hypothetical protein HND27_10790 [Bacteroidetes bacterium]|nr:hypothetical protein [Bacteroidota bacterium]
MSIKTINFFIICLYLVSCVSEKKGTNKYNYFANLIDSVEFAINVEKYEKATFLIHILLREDSTHIKTNELYAELLKNLGRYNESTAIYTKLVELNPQNAIWYYTQQSELNAKLGKKKVALSLANKVFQLSEDTFDYFFLKSNVHLYLKEYNSALNNLDSVLSINYSHFSNNEKKILLYQKTYVLLCSGDTISTCLFYNLNKEKIDSFLINISQGDRFDFCNESDNDKQN